MDLVSVIVVIAVLAVVWFLLDKYIFPLLPRRNNPMRPTDSSDRPALEDEFARYLLAYETEGKTGEPEFDQITNVGDLARFLLRLRCGRVGSAGLTHLAIARHD